MSECIEIRQDLDDDDDEKPLAALAAIVKSEENQIEFHVDEEDDDDMDNNDSLDHDMNELEEGEIPVGHNQFEHYNENDNGVFIYFISCINILLLFIRCN